MTPPTIEQALELSVASCAARQDMEAVFHTVQRLSESLHTLLLVAGRSDLDPISLLYLHDYGKRIQKLIMFTADLGVHASGVDEFLIADCKGAQ